MKKEQIYRVEFREPPFTVNGRTEFFFSSFSAIYTMFTAEDIGCRVTRLWNIGVSNGKPYEGRRCRITRELLTAKSRKVEK